MGGWIFPAFRHHDVKFLEVIVPEAVPEAAGRLLTLPSQLLPVFPVPYLAVSVGLWAGDCVCCALLPPVT